MFSVYRFARNSTTVAEAHEGMILVFQLRLSRCRRQREGGEVEARSGAQAVTGRNLQGAHRQGGADYSVAKKNYAALAGDGVRRVRAAPASMSAIGGKADITFCTACVRI